MCNVILTKEIISKLKYIFLQRKYHKRRPVFTLVTCTLNLATFLEVYL